MVEVPISNEHLYINDFLPARIMKPNISITLNLLFFYIWKGNSNKTTNKWLENPSTKGALTQSRDEQQRAHQEKEGTTHA